MNNEYSFTARIFSLGCCRFLSFFCDFVVMGYTYFTFHNLNIMSMQWLLFSFVLCYLIPAVVVADIAKRLIRRISSRNALVLSCLLTIPVYLLFTILLYLQNVRAWDSSIWDSPIPLLAATVILGTFRGLAAPATQELMHEHFQSGHFAHATGICSAMSTAGMLCGAILGLFLLGHIIKYIIPAVILLFILAMVKLIFAMRILPVPFPE